MSDCGIISMVLLCDISARQNYKLVIIPCALKQTTYWYDVLERDQKTLSLHFLCSKRESVRTLSHL